LEVAIWELKLFLSDWLLFFPNPGSMVIRPGEVSCYTPMLVLAEGLTRLLVEG
jgi:hypothetical protein